MILVWRVTQRCNLTCPFCEWDRSLPRARVEADPQEVLRFANLLAGWQASTGRRVLVSWLGGEPLLWQSLESVAGQVGSKGLAQSATTNGTTLGQAKVQDFVLRHFAELTVSVDGFSDFHDPMRGWPGGHTKLREAVQTLHARRANRDSLRLRANVVLMRQSVASFPDLCEALASWGLDEITFNALGGRDRPEFYQEHALRPQDVENLRAALPALRASLLARGIRLSGEVSYLDRIAASASGNAIPVADCSPGRSFLFVDERGLIAPCDFTLADYAIPTSEITSVAELQQLPARFAAQQRQARSTACDDCRSTRVFAKFSA